MSDPRVGFRHRFCAQFQVRFSVLIALDRLSTVTRQLIAVGGGGPRAEATVGAFDAIAVVVVVGSTDRWRLFGTLAVVGECPVTVIGAGRRLPRRRRRRRCVVVLILNSRLVSGTPIILDVRSRTATHTLEPVSQCLLSA